MSSSTMNPFALGGWQAPGEQATSALTFRILHPSGEAGEVKGPVDILNCVVVDPHDCRYLTIGTSIPTRGMTIDPVTSIQDTKGSIVARVEWPSSDSRYPFVQSDGDIKVPRQASNVFLQATVNPTMRSISIEGRHYTWVQDAQKFKLYSGGNGFQAAELLVTVTTQYTGSLSLSVSGAALEEGTLLLSILALVIVLPARR
ncbi:hypothetical protein FA13DRAFT_691082 [Coprinellus micaceus]|uniref:Uncharacterized protein n=1 Tax=Coprinellus micaceus TaxID=71717 RepID=A0A4Y7T698_COPMI|nr:hypothetical protein FA13DRAFT_691082 [Coprinellus micaceus]